MEVEQQGRFVGDAVALRGHNSIANEPQAFDVPPSTSAPEVYVPAWVQDATTGGRRMKTYVNQMTLGRRVGRCADTIAKKLADGSIVPDGVVITGGRQSLLFDMERLPAIRKALSDSSKEVVL